MAWLFQKINAEGRKHDSALGLTEAHILVPKYLYRNVIGIVSRQVREPSVLDLPWHGGKLCPGVRCWGTRHERSLGCSAMC